MRKHYLPLEKVKSTKATNLEQQRLVEKEGVLLLEGVFFLFLHH